MSDQLPLTLRWPAQQRFDTYVAGENAAALALLRTVADANDSAWVYLAGPPSSGKTHLLIAACAESAKHGRRAQYVPLAKIGGDRAAAIRALGGSDLIAIDDIDAIAGDAASEHALFDFYNRSKAESAVAIFAAKAPAAQIGIVLPDLVSRLASCTQAGLKPLSDSARREAVLQRARARGLMLDDAVVDFLFAHSQRDLGTLSTLIERIDRESLAAKRRITVAFLRRLLDRDA